MKTQHRLKALNGQGDALRQEGARCLLRGIFESDDGLLTRGREIDQILARRGALRVIVTSDSPEIHQSEQ